MIISERTDKERVEFEQLLNDAHTFITEEANVNPDYFNKRTATEFEQDIFNILCKVAKGTDFETTLQLISGRKFPDIVIKRFYGVEVKTTKQNHWKSLGNSILESTRIDNVELIYLFFAQLTTPAKFKYRLYQECLYEIAVTHSPRYLIDMELEMGRTIFDKMDVSYDELRSRDNPIKSIVSYYRSIAKRGEEPWWMGGDEITEVLIKPTVSLWSNLSQSSKDTLKNEAMARFPEIFSKSSTKYQQLASWLAAKHGVVDSSLRDRFSAGGKVDLVVDGQMYHKLPRIFAHLQNKTPEIIQAVKNLPADEAGYYWKLSYEPNQEQKLAEWAKMMISYSSQILYDSEQFIVHLLGLSFSQEDCPNQIKEGLVHYALNK